MSLCNKCFTKKSPPKQLNETLIELGLNYYKVGIIFDTHQRMRAKWTPWDGPCLVYGFM